MFWSPDQNVGWFRALKASMSSSTFLVSVMLTVFLRRMSISKVHGPLEHAALQAAESPRARIEKDLALESRLAVRVHARSVGGIDGGLGNHHGAVSGHLEFDHAGELRAAEERIGAVVVGARFAVEGSPPRQDRERRAGLPDHGAAEDPAADDAVQRAVVQSVALAERQLVEAVGFDHVGEIEVGARPLDTGVVDIEEVLEARLAVAIGVAQHLGKGVIGLEAQTGTHLVARLELQRVVTGAGVVSQQVGAQGVGVLVEIDQAIHSVGLQVVAQFAHLAGLKVIEDIGIAQRAAGEFRKDRQLLAAGDGGIVVRIENAALCHAPASRCSGRAGSPAGSRSG